MSVRFRRRHAPRIRGARAAGLMPVGGVQSLEPRVLFSTTVFSDNFEASALSTSWANQVYDYAVDARWGVNRAKAAPGGSQSAFSSTVFGGSLTRATYESGQRNGLRRDNVSLSGYSSARLSFKYFLNTESGYDIFSVA